MFANRIHLLLDWTADVWERQKNFNNRLNANVTEKIMIFQDVVVFSVSSIGFCLSHEQIDDAGFCLCVCALYSANFSSDEIHFNPFKMNLSAVFADSLMWSFVGKILPSVSASSRCARKKKQFSLWCEKLLLEIDKWPNRKKVLSLITKNVPSSQQLRIWFKHSLPRNTNTVMKKKKCVG